MKIKESIVVLDNIRSVHNVGSIFRTADALGVSKIYLCGCTPTPTDRFGRERQDLAKTALGAEKTIAWEYSKDTLSVLVGLKKKKFQIVVIEQDEKSEDCRKIKVKSKIALILGNEVDGVSKDVLKKADDIAEIPMFGKKESLNVSVSFGIAGFCLLQR